MRVTRGFIGRIRAFLAAGLGTLFIGRGKRARFLHAEKFKGRDIERYLIRA